MSFTRIEFWNQQKAESPFEISLLKKLSFVLRLRHKSIKIIKWIKGLAGLLMRFIEIDFENRIGKLFYEGEVLISEGNRLLGK